MRRSHLVIALAAVALGGLVLVWPGPGRVFVRGWLGDVAAAALVAALVGVARPRWSTARRATAAFVVAAAVEVVQAVAGPRWRGDRLAELTVGTTFDAGDLLAYAIGAYLAAAGGARLARQGPLAASGS
jgi:hypothetical protein